jgi:hypothetical protein
MLRFRTAGLRGFAAVLLFTAAVGLAACGGDEDSVQPTEQEAADVRAISKLGDQMTAAMRQANMKELCSLMVEDDVNKTFGGKAKCRRALQANLASSGQQPKFEFSEITIKDDEALALNGADNDSTVYFARVDDQWLIDLSPDIQKFQPVEQQEE